MNGLSNWYVEKNTVNKGWRRNFVDVAALAKGKYIFFCDQDDIWISDKVETMVTVMENNCQINVLAGRYIRFKEVVPTDEILGTYVHPVKPDNHLLYTDLPGCVYCVRKDFWNDIIQYWNGVFSHDAICWAAAKLQQSAYILERPVIFWRSHFDSTYTIASREIKSRKNRVNWLKTAQKNIECLERIASTLGFNERALDSIKRYSEFNSLRIDVLEKKELLRALKLLAYLDCYNKRRQYILELYLIIKHD